VHVRELDEVDLEAALRDAGWELEEIEMEPQLDMVPLCHTDMLGHPVTAAARVSAVQRRTVLLASKAGLTIGNCYDRDGHPQDRAVALLGLAISGGAKELDE
jgi:hypothetical protein